jgi:hypothetical protein
MDLLGMATAVSEIDVDSSRKPLVPVLAVAGPTALKQNTAVDRCLLIYANRSANPPAVPLEAESGLVESVVVTKGYGFIRYLCNLIGDLGDHVCIVDSNGLLPL